MRHEDMMRGFDRFSERMAKRYQEVRDCLQAKRYAEAQMLLADIATSHARTSLSLRNVLIKERKLGEK